MDTDSTRLSRLIALLIQLQSKRIFTAAEAAKRFGVSVRTIYRDMKVLASAGVPVFPEEGRGYSVREEFRLPPIMFTGKEANALMTAEKMVRLNKDSSLIEEYGNAVTKIKAAMKSKSRDDVDFLASRVAFWEPPVEETSSQKTSSQLLSSIQTALTEMRVIEIQYSAASNGQTTLRSVEPFAVINKLGENWYLIAWCRLKKDFRLFRFDRIMQFTVTDERFLKHTLTLESYLKKYREQF